MRIVLIADASAAHHLRCRVTTPAITAQTALSAESASEARRGTAHARATDRSRP
jgi:hypothetical protein